MITIDNYAGKISSLNISTLPEALQKGHEFLMKATQDATNWNAYHKSPAIKKTIDIYLEKLNAHVSTGAATKPSEKPELKPKRTPAKQEAKPAPRKEVPTPPVATQVERITDEVRFIKRYVNLNGKIKTREDILRFINSLQKAIVEKRIRKTSPHAADIRYIQQKLIEVYNTMKSKIRLEMKPETFERFKALVGEQKVRLTVGFIKSYINLNGKPGMKKKADALLQRITKAVDRKLIPADDPYMDEVIIITKNLEQFLDNPSQKELQIEANELNGLQGILGCNCKLVGSLGQLPTVMNSMEFSNLEFKTIGLKGKWYDLIGDPSSNFTAMVFGKPKMGKSYLCIEFAGYLTRHHGKVLYVAKEEGLDLTLQKKLNEKEVAHPDLFVASALPASLQKYDFVFLDSVNKLGLTPEDLSRLKQANPHKSFVFIFQTTKTGAFRGANTFQHDVDVVIEVPERGKAIQNGRFNQGGELNTFEDYF